MCFVVWAVSESLLCRSEKQNSAENIPVSRSLYPQSRIVRATAGAKMGFFSKLNVPDEPNQFPPPGEDEQALALEKDWTLEEEVKAKRK